MPSHNHGHPFHYGGNGSTTAHGSVYNSGMGASTVPTYDAGGGQAHENMPPYITVYMFKRTA